MIYACAFGQANQLCQKAMAVLLAAFTTISRTFPHKNAFLDRILKMVPI
jgi:hypothetical protein